jgi:hypothetical protein
MMKRTQQVVAALIGVACACGAAAAGQGKAVQGNEMRALFAEHEFGDGVHFAYRFRTDGVFSGTEMGKNIRGTWRLSGAQICWTWTRPPGAEECYVARRNGEEVGLYRDGVEHWYGTLKPIGSAKR